MDRKKTKKIRSARIVATNIFMSISVVAIVAVLMLIAMGFSFDESGDIQQSGLLQITSQPTRASVEIDQETLLSTTEVNKMVASGPHEIKITKSGYDNWSRQINLEAGLLTRIEWVRLFPIEQNIESVDSFKSLRLVSYSADSKHLLAAETNGATLNYLDLQSNPVKRAVIPLTQALGTNDVVMTAQGSFKVESWNDGNNKVLLRWTRAEQSSWHLVDLTAPEKSINLNDQFALNFTKIAAANDSASKLWALADNNLYFIDLGTAQISDALATKVERFANNKDTVAYLAEHALYTYKDGEEGAVKILDLKEGDNIIFEMGTYWGDEWIAYAVNQDLYLLAGKYPNYKKNEGNTLERFISHENLPYTPTAIDVNASDRIITFWSGKDLASFDIETRDYYDLELDGSNSVDWLDNYLLWESHDNKLVVRDFDGNNRREIIASDAPISHAIISGNNQWLYYFETITTPAPTEENPMATTQTIVLKRLKLNV